MIVPSKLCCFFPFSPSALTSYSHSIFPNAGVHLPQGPKQHPRSPLPSFHGREARPNVPPPVARPGEQLGSRLCHGWPVPTQPQPQAARGTARLQGEERRACLCPAHDATVMWGCVCVCVCVICVLCEIYVCVYICVCMDVSMCPYLCVFMCKWTSQVIHGKESTRQCRSHRRRRFHPWVRKIPWRSHRNPLQQSCQDNPMDRGAWQHTHGVTNSQT